MAERKPQKENSFWYSAYDRIEAKEQKNDFYVFYCRLP